MRSNIIKATFGVPTDMLLKSIVKGEIKTEKLTDLFFENLKECMVEVYNKTDIYVSYLIKREDAIYPNGDHKPIVSETVITIEATYNPYYGTRLEDWINANREVIKMMKDKLNQTSVTVTRTESDIEYLLSDASDKFYNGIYPDCCVYWSKLRPDAIIPNKRSEDAGYDIYPCFDEDYIYIEPHETQIIDTGIASCIPSGFEFQVEERGSTGSKGIQHSAGVFDSGYRGEWFLCLTNTTEKPIIIVKKDKLDYWNNTQIIDMKDAIDRIITSSLSDSIIYPYEKALFQAILINVNNHLEPREIPYTQLSQIDSVRKDGSLGSSNK